MIDGVIKEHFGFILTIIITYVLGIILTIVQYIALEGDKNIIKVFMDSLIPTTITYVLGCVLVNIADLLRNKADNYVYNVLTCLAVMIYAIVFCIYIMMGFNWGMAVVEIIFTIILLVLNIMCYNERYKNRNHGLV